ncbi:hypothetical protein [Bacillus cereus group sp. RP32]|uniref:hypothetical protein n=1 Tax=Bacillus cereus group sp. RP32 TaxID=3040258 RepID=UPI0033914D69
MSKFGLYGKFIVEERNREELTNILLEAVKGWNRKEAASRWMLLLSILFLNQQLSKRVSQQRKC